MQKKQLKKLLYYQINKLIYSKIFQIYFFIFSLNLILKFFYFFFFFNLKQ